MDFRKIRRMLFIMIFLFLLLVGVIAAANLDQVKQKLGLGGQGGTEEETEEAQADRGD